MRNLCERGPDHSAHPPTTGVPMSTRMLGLALVLVTGLAGCTSGHDTSKDAPAAATSGTAAQTAAARTESARFLQPATSLNIDTPLTSAPARGKRVFWLEGN